jgi:carbonic anhydrase/acetyltransferase-like protein (isoleucine patch superfamily)
MIAAGSLVSPNKILESGILYKGSPAKPIRDLTEKEQKYILFSSNHYVNVMREHIGK